MLTVSREELRELLAAFGVTEGITETEELLRYDFEERGPEARDVRLMLRCGFAGRGRWW